MGLSYQQGRVLLREFAELGLLEPAVSGEDERVNNTCHGKRPTDDGAKLIIKIATDSLMKANKIRCGKILQMGLNM